MKKQLASRGTSWFVLTLTALMCCALFTGAGVAQSPVGDEVRDAGSEVSSTDLPVNVEGVMVRIDAATGRLQPPTPQEMKALREALARLLESKPLQSVQAPTVQLDGTVRSVVPPSLHEVSIFRIDPEGGLTSSCVHGLEKASGLLGLPVATPVLEPSAPEEE